MFKTYNDMSDTYINQRKHSFLEIEVKNTKTIHDIKNLLLVFKKSFLCNRIHVYDNQSLWHNGGNVRSEPMLALGG